MLETARHCFTSAARCEGDGDEEEWLIHYMLGKVAEKQQQPPAVYLLHYRQAGHYLHEEAARYPKKIHYHNPPELAMEALEVTPCWPWAGKQGRSGPGSLSPWGWGMRSQWLPRNLLETSLCSAALCVVKLKQPFLSLLKGAYHPFWESDCFVCLSKSKITFPPQHMQGP